MAGQMCWLDPNGGDGEKILHLRMNPGDRWRPYTAPEFSRLRQPDYSMSKIKLSKGLSTAQTLLKLGWVYIRSNEANLENPRPVELSDSISMTAAIAQAKRLGLVQ